MSEGVLNVQGQPPCALAPGATPKAATSCVSGELSRLFARHDARLRRGERRVSPPTAHLGANERVANTGIVQQPGNALQVVPGRRTSELSHAAALRGRQPAAIGLGPDWLPHGWRSGTRPWGHV